MSALLPVCHGTLAVLWSPEPGQGGGWARPPRRGHTDNSDTAQGATFRRGEGGLSRVLCAD